MMPRSVVSPTATSKWEFADNGLMQRREASITICPSAR
jgi:nuclear transport factor 2 (NTF2) superfamily protein